MFFAVLCLLCLCASLFICALWSGSRLSCLTVSLSLSHWYPGSGVVVDCIDSRSLHPYLFYMSLSGDKQTYIIDDFNTTSRFLDDILNINNNNVYFDNIVSQIYPSELQLNKAYTFDTEKK